MASALIDHALRYGWDRRRGGFYFAGPGLGPPRLQDQNLIVQKKQLWVQMGALKALLALHSKAAEERYLQWFKRQWCYIQNELIDTKHRGFHTAGLETLPWWQRRARRLAPASITRKGSNWKDSSHDGLSLLYCMSLVNNVSSDNDTASSVTVSPPLGPVHRQRATAGKQTGAASS